MYEPIEPLVFRLGELESVDKNREFIKNLWNSNISDVEKGVQEGFQKIIKEEGQNDGIREIALDEFLNKLSKNKLVRLVIGITDINNKKYIRLDSLYKLKSESEELTRYLWYITKFEHEKEVSKLFKSVYGFSFEDYY